MSRRGVLPAGDEFFLRNGMQRKTVKRILALCAAAYSSAVLQSGCANVPPGELTQGQKWYLEMEAEKKRLDDMGFPQYSGK